MKHIILVSMLSCVEFSNAFERDAFENQWWETQGYPMCFNFHESGTLFSYQPQELQVGHWRQLIDEGQWEYHIPNEYSVLDKSIFVYEDKECWEIEEFYDAKVITACECTLLDDE
tara:strand:- start:1309 stop:1653 length:345 start_codon:yes stop_codon:yes gene_type:complete